MNQGKDKRRKLSKGKRDELLIEINKLIDETCELSISNVFNGDISVTYPPNGGYTEAELDALKIIKNVPNIENFLRKFIADATARPLFHLFCDIDGVGELDGYSLLDRNDELDEEGDMLHDDFFGAYWEWKKIRSKKDWKLDNL